MRKLLVSLVAIGAALFATSCVNELEEGIQGNAGQVTFTVNAPELATRAYGDGSAATKLLYAVYDVTAGGEVVENGVSVLDIDNAKAITPNAKTTIQLELLDGNEYSLLFWAVNANYAEAFTIDWDGKAMEMKQTIEANNEAYDAFYAYVEPFTVKGAITKSVTLTRPFAQLNYGSNDFNEAKNLYFEPEKSQVVIKNVPNVLNCVDGSVDGNVTITYASASIPVENFTVANNKYLAMNYVLVGEKKLFDTTLKVTAKNGKVIENDYATVPLQRNYRTNVYGSLLTNKSDFGVELKPGFAEPATTGPVFDPANRTIMIYDKESLLGLTELNANWVAMFSNGQGTAYSNYAAVNGGKGVDYYYKWGWTIKLYEDIDLGGMTLNAPINLHTWGQFDGQGHTIKNANIAASTSTYAGLFRAGGAAMKNIVIDNVHVEGSFVGNSSAGILASDCNSGVDNITIKNSSVKGGKYTGGVVGYGYTDVTNCTLDNCSVEGGYKCGGVIGYVCASNNQQKHVDSNTLRKCTVKDAGQYADGKTEFIIGKVVGNYNCNGTCKDNSIIDMTTTATELIGKIEAGKNVAYEGIVFDPANRTIMIYDKESLLGLTELNDNWVAMFSNGLGTDYSNYAAVNGGKGVDYYYKWGWTIKLYADIDLGGMTLNAPINLHTWGQFDGQGHTIKNANIAASTSTYAGLFRAGGAAMKNIVIDNVHVEGSFVGNSSAGILASDCNSGVDNITIKNSSVKGGKYTGGVVGYGYTDVTNCTLDNCSVEGGYKCGGVIGYVCASNNQQKHVDSNTLRNCTVKDAGQYADGKTEFIIGKVVGNYNCDGTCKDNSIINMTTTATELIGKIEAAWNVEVE